MRVTDGWGSDVPDWPLDEEPPFDPFYDAAPPEHEPAPTSARGARAEPPPRPDIPREVAQTLDPEAALAAAAEVLHTVLGYDAFRGEQEEIIEHVVARRRRPGAHADRRRQVAVLPDPGAGPGRHRAS